MMHKRNLIILVILYTITTSFTPGGNGFYDSFFSAPATSNTKIVRIYPNPATTVINFEFDKNVESTNTIAIYSFYGKKMSEQRLSNNKVTFILDDNYTRGLYVFQLRDQTGKLIESGKFQVSK
jgi:hypothetical protein